jgi:hypothetical protein
MLARWDPLPLELRHQPFFVLGIFEIGSRELFVWAGFDLLILLTSFHLLLNLLVS